MVYTVGGWSGGGFGLGVVGLGVVGLGLRFVVSICVSPQPAVREKLGRDAVRRQRSNGTLVGMRRGGRERAERSIPLAGGAAAASGGSAGAAGGGVSLPSMACAGGWAR